MSKELSFNFIVLIDFFFAQKLNLFFGLKKQNFEK